MTTSSDSLPPFLSLAWWNLVITNWNTHASRSVLGGLGVLVFETEAEGYDPITVRFADDGSAELVEATTESLGRFRATPENWHAFISGKFGAPEGVMRKRIIFSGSYPHILRYANAFNTFAQAARAFLAVAEPES